MKGQVLGFNVDSGAITGEDGHRYAFVVADWKGERPPQPRDSVDFVASDGQAIEIYPLASAFSASLNELGGALRKGTAGAGSTVTNSGALTFVAERPQLMLHGLIIFVMLFFPFATGVEQLGGGVGQSSTALSVPSDTQKAANMLVAASQTVGGLLGSEAARAMPSTALLSTAATLTYLFYLIPLVAAFAIFRDATGKRMKVLDLVAGGLSILTLPIFMMVKSGLSGSMGPLGNAATAGLSLSIGAFFLLLCGVLLVLTGIGVIKRTPGL